VLKAFLTSAEMPIVINASKHDAVIFFDREQYEEFRDSPMRREDVEFASEVAPDNAR
jgi:hypothetical protein